MLLEVSARLGLALEVLLQDGDLFLGKPWPYGGVLGLSGLFEGRYDRSVHRMGGYDVGGVDVFWGGPVAVLVEGQERRLEVLLLIYI